MKVDLEKRFALPGPAEVAWGFLQDVQAVAECMPGAKITEALPGGGFKGTVTVRLGPATMSFRGQVDVRDVDAATRSLRLIGKGTDGTGSSGASMDLAARIEPVSESTSELVGVSSISMSGRAASFGARMMDPVAEQVLRQFAENFAARVAERAAPQAASAAGAEPTPQPARPAPARELGLFALLWGALRDRLRGLFGQKAA
jgi:carbon monoxide dehydrogenase subunit G